MSAVFYRKKKNKIYARRMLFVIVLVLLAALLNADSIRRFFHPLPYYNLTSKYAAAYNRTLPDFRHDKGGKQLSARGFRKGARGLMQIMPETGQSVAAQLDYPKLQRGPAVHTGNQY